MCQPTKVVIVSRAFPTLSFPSPSLTVPLAWSVSTSHVHQAPLCFGAIAFTPLVPFARAFQLNSSATYGRDASSSSLDG
jgi:hypothetical protein